MSDNTSTRKDEFRALPGGYELRQNSKRGGMPTLIGNLPLGEWAEIRSAREGHFMERMSPTAFDKTIAENGDRMRALFNHGHDPSIGDKVLGPLSLRTDEGNVHYEVDLLDTSYNRDLVPGLEAGLYGSSFRFEVIRQDMNDRAEKASHNPKGLPERTVTEVRMSELGPVTFPAYAGAKSGIRSLTDKFAREQQDVKSPDTDGERQDEEHPDKTPAPPEGTPAVPRRSEPVYGMIREEQPAWLIH